VPISTRQDLHAHLDLAIRVELTTVPPYLYAMYSIVDQRSSPARLLRSIVVEEMLHAVLASNVLLGVGGSPRFRSPAYVPRYPGWVPHHRPPLEVRLEAERLGPAVVVHDYGHGGSGVTLSWGCARDVARFAQQAFGAPRGREARP
jgi:hypothetical protein